MNAPEDRLASTQSDADATQEPREYHDAYRTAGNAYSASSVPRQFDLNEKRGPDRVAETARAEHGRLRLELLFDHGRVR